jgi:endonuclease YncB( thermonuclease family)
MDTEYTDPVLRNYIVGAALLLSGCASCPACPTCPTPPPCPECPTAVDHAQSLDRTWFVLRAIDGDTLVVRLEGGEIERKETVRLLNVNTPEKNQPGFGEAREALKTLVRGGEVKLECEDPLVEKRDGFGRLLAYVIADGVNVNVELVRRGWSRLYIKYGKRRLHDEFAAAEAEARAAGRGLWGLQPTPQ